MNLPTKKNRALGGRGRWGDSSKHGTEKHIGHQTIQPSPIRQLPIWFLVIAYQLKLKFQFGIFPPKISKYYFQTKSHFRHYCASPPLWISLSLLLRKCWSFQIGATQIGRSRRRGLRSRRIPKMTTAGSSETLFLPTKLAAGGLIATPLFRSSLSLSLSIWEIMLDNPVQFYLIRFCNFNFQGKGAKRSVSST